MAWSVDERGVCNVRSLTLMEQNFINLMPQAGIWQPRGGVSLLCLRRCFEGRLVTGRHTGAV